MNRITECRSNDGIIQQYEPEPRFCEMEHRTLEDKGMNGPTLAHVIEEIHTPVNLAAITTTTGTSAFQNPVGITYEEMYSRTEAGKKALKHSGLKNGDRILVTYPPLVGVFTRQAFEEFGVEVSFLLRSSRDALLTALLEQCPQAVIGESRFLKSVLQIIENIEGISKLPAGLIFIAAGTPLDMELLELVDKIPDARIHDLYGCQEFGWLTLDGNPLRDDIWLLAVSKNRSQVVVGGLPTGDSFLIHPSGRIITHSGRRMETEWESILYETTAANAETARRTAHTILRLKGRVVRVSEKLVTGAGGNVLGIRMVEENGFSHTTLFEGKTKMFDDLMQAQMSYQSNGKNDPVWRK